MPGGFVYQVRRRGLDTQPWVAPPECIRFFFCATSVVHFWLPFWKERERLKHVENQTSTSKQLELAAVLEASSSDSLRKRDNQCLDFEFNIVANI